MTKILPPPPPKECAICGTLFQPQRRGKHVRFCSLSCRQKDYRNRKKLARLPKEDLDQLLRSLDTMKAQARTAERDWARQQPSYWHEAGQRYDNDIVVPAGYKAVITIRIVPDTDHKDD